MVGLERINALLDGREQYMFNRFIERLAVNKQVEVHTLDPWQPSNAWRKEKILLAARDSGRFDGLA